MMIKSEVTNTQKILSIDIGGTHIKATLLDAHGRLLKDYEKVDTPEKATPAHVLESIKKLASGLKGYDKISAGFPGYIKNGIVLTAPNLDSSSWKQFDLEKELTNMFKKPARILNDADMQGLGVVSGDGLEMLITLGTGLGSALLMNGQLLPHFELAHHPFTKSKDYDDYIGDKALRKKGVAKWNKRMQKVLKAIQIVFNYDRLYIGGGNAELLSFKLDANIHRVTNEDGIKGGARLWHPENKKETNTKSIFLKIRN